MHPTTTSTCYRQDRDPLSHFPGREADSGSMRHPASALGYRHCTMGLVEQSLATRSSNRQCEEESRSYVSIAYLSSPANSSKIEALAIFS